MANRPYFFRSFFLSALLLAAAGLIAVPLFRVPQTDSTPLSAEARIKTLLPNADPRLIHRVTETWGWNAVKAAEEHAEEGLLALEAFEDEAGYCLQHDPKAFSSLAKVVRLEPDQFRLASGPWNRAVLDWAQNGKLGRFLDRLHTLSPDKLAIAEGTPASLPLLLFDAAPTAQKMLEKHGQRAWRLFMAVNFHDHPEDLERIAKAVANEGDLLLRLNEEFGLAYALLLVPADTKKDSKQFPEVVKYALGHLEDEPTALSLMLTNYDSITEMLNANRPVRDLEDAIDYFGALPPVVRDIAIDHRQTLRLLAETWHGRKVGSQVLRRCGPSAADLIYGRYASDDKLKWPALVAMARLGEPAFQVFHRYREYDKFHELLRKSDSILMSPTENPPAIVHAIYNISKKDQPQVDVYATVSNLKGQVLADVRGPLPEEEYLEWVPGYIVYRTTAEFIDGRHVTGGDVFWASVDAVSSAAMLYGPVVNGFKAVGGKLGQEAATVFTKEAIIQGDRALVHSGLREAEKEVTKSIAKLALKALKREGIELGRFGENAGAVATRRLEARSQGLALNLADRRTQFVKLAEAGDINGRARLVEEIGVEGAHKYAAEVGYKPLHGGPPRKGMGFDIAPCTDGNRIIVIEAKGGSAPIQTYRGHVQGSIEYTKEVAEWTIRSPKTTAEEKKAAEEVLKAANQGRLHVEIVRTEHVYGKPGFTRVEKTIGPNGPATFSLEEAKKALLQVPGMATAWVRRGSAKAETDLPGWLNNGQSVARRTGIALWSPGIGPLAPRDVVRKGTKSNLVISGAPTRAVSDFVIALMERGM